MFGLKKEPNEKKIFEFDLEKELHDAKRKKEIDKEIQEKIMELKDILRKGVDSDESFEDYGILLRGYAALQKITNRVALK